MEQELTRATVDPKYTWDVTRVYADDAQWEKAFEQVKEGGKAFAALAGTLAQGKEAILHACQQYAKLNEQLSGVYCYAMMKQNEDTTVAAYQALLGRAASLASELAADSAFFMPEMLALLGEEDILMITADHGCDPATPSTDHSREYIPLVMAGAPLKAGSNIGTRPTFADIAATILDYFGVAGDVDGTSFLNQIV